MEKRNAFAVLGKLLLISTLALAFAIQPIKCEAGMIIVPDDYGTIQEAIDHANIGDTIYVRAGIYDEAPSLSKESITLAGESSSNTVITGLLEGSADHITIVNFEIQGGIRVFAGAMTEVREFTLRNNVVRSRASLSIFDSVIESNIFEGGLSISGIYHIPAYWNVINNNTLLGPNGLDMWEGGQGNIISRNTIVNAKVGIFAYDDGDTYRFQWNNLTENHLVQCGTGIHLIFRSNPWIGKYIASDSIISGNAFENNNCGIHCENATCVTIYDNKLLKNQQGINLTHSNNNSICGNEILDSGFNGIWIEGSNNTIDCNIVANNTGDGIVLCGPGNNNTVSRNNVASNKAHGIEVLESSGNSIFHNNFIDNTCQAQTTGLMNNFWDDGYPSGGNYWSDCTDVDLYNGPNQDLPGMDGIWDHPYFIDVDNRDRYPFVKPWPTIPAIVDVALDTLHLKSRGKWITAYIQLPEGFSAEDIDPTSVLLNGTVSPVLDPQYDFVADPSEYLVDHNCDGILERMVKFDRVTVQLFIYDQGFRNCDVTLTVTGKLFDDSTFEGTDTITVITNPPFKR